MREFDGIDRYKKLSIYMIIFPVNLSLGIAIWIQYNSMRELESFRSSPSETSKRNPNKSKNRVRVVAARREEQIEAIK